MGLTMPPLEPPIDPPDDAVADLMDLHGCTEDEAIAMLDAAQAERDDRREEGKQARLDRDYWRNAE